MLIPVLTCHYMLQVRHLGNATGEDGGAAALLCETGYEWHPVRAPNREPGTSAPVPTL